MYPHRTHALIVTSLALCALSACQRQEEGKAPPPVPEVLVIEAGTKNVPVYREWIGTLDGSENADIRARVTGHLMKRNYQEGSLVKKGGRAFRDRPAAVRGRAGRGRKPAQPGQGDATRLGG